MSIVFLYKSTCTDHKRYGKISSYVNEKIITKRKGGRNEKINHIKKHCRNYGFMS